MLAKANQAINRNLRKIKYAHLLALFMIVFAFLNIDPPKTGVMAFMAAEFGVSPRVYSLWLVATGTWLLSRPQTKSITLYCAPLAFYSVAAALYGFYTGLESARITTLWYSAFTFAIMIIGSKNDEGCDDAK